ncbi:MAG TPA: DUF2891 domain-containing protein [Micropepsaceae bacterium]|nr:DUF2891 domain-containing protein [Micropepsaceae bacterium]
MSLALDAGMAGRMARIALSHVTREFPNKLDHVMTGPQDAQTPRALHPVFFGSFDWHSCVHSYWLLATLYRLFPDNPESAAIRTLFDESLTAGKAAGEYAYLARSQSRAFERPYGWAWLLRLQAELLRQGEKTWSSNLRPLADAIVERFREWLPRATYPVRVGTHGNTAFALRLAFDFAQTVRDVEFFELLRSTAIRWYAEDKEDRCREPSGEDFLSPALTEAQCMACALPPDEFRGWFARFLPRLAQGEPRCLFEPAQVSDRSDGRIVHLDGLNLSRAWSWFEIAARVSADEPLRKLAVDMAERHLSSALTRISGDYMGEHWLATYALLALLAGQQLNRP